MNLQVAQKIANAVLYEGYMLYPYRPSAIKNQQRFNFGVLYPRAYCDATSCGESWMSQTECLIRGGVSSRVEVRVRFLQMVDRLVRQKDQSSSEFQLTDKLEADGKTYLSWQEAVEQEIAMEACTLGDLASQREFCFEFGEAFSSQNIENSHGIQVGDILRHRDSIRLSVLVSAIVLSSEVARLTVQVRNVRSSDTADERFDGRLRALMRAPVSTHIILGVEYGEFVSQIDPPNDLRDKTADCRNVGVFPVLVGGDGERDTMMASPIILYDYPQIAPESAGELFDGTEIDEILSLRILTLTEEEKAEMRSSDERSRLILDRTESIPVEQFMKLHGVLRDVRPAGAATHGSTHDE